MAVKWFHCTPRELGERLSSYEYSELIAWHKIEREDEERENALAEVRRK